MIGLGLGTNRIYRSGGGGDTFDTDYQAVLDQASSLGYNAPSPAQQTLQNTLVTDLKTAGVWDKLDLLYVFATDGDSDYATLNWKSPGNFQITKVNSPTFTTNQGFAQSGTALLDTNFQLNTNSINYTQNDAGAFIGFPTLSGTVVSQNRALGTSGTANYLDFRLDGNGSNINNRIWLNSTSYQTLSLHKVDNSIVFGNRTGSTGQSYRSTDLVNNSTFEASVTITPAPLPSENVVILKSRSTDYFETTANVGIAAIGSSLSTAEMEAVETAWYTNYFASL